MDGVTLVSVLLILLLQLSASEGSVSVCESNLHCCRYPPWTPEFKACYGYSCRPDCFRVNYMPAVKKFAMKDGCQAAYECCVYPAFSDSWNKCCSKHSCCPLCHKVSKGCCYNGKQYEWGTVVDVIPSTDDLPEDYINLKCGAKVSWRRPYFTAVIVPIQKTYYIEEECEQCNEGRYCLEENGLIHENGTEWFQTPCYKCICTYGHVDCVFVRPRCPPAPYPECVPIPPAPGECCNAWDCSRLDKMCIDAYGEFHREGEEWTGRSDPCLLYICKAGGMTLSANRQCPPPQATIPSGCQLRTHADQCCPELHCPECADEYSKTYSINETWVDLKNPCYVNKCLAGGQIDRTKKTCPPLYRYSTANCVLQEENCCPKWICGGCTDQHGKVHASGSTWTDPDDPCITYHCGEQGIRLAYSGDCPPLGPQPAYGCKKVKKNCCYEWQCLGDITYCVDYHEQRREIGDKWYDPLNPCIVFECKDDLKIHRGIRECADPPPSPSPDCYMQVEQCCPVWRCPCVDNSGTEKLVGDVWEHPTNKCLSLVCTAYGAVERKRPCPDLSTAPSTMCKPRHDGCCTTWDCPVCPDPNSFGIACIQFKDQCYSDKDCGYDRKCCLVAGCGHQCIVVKPGRCPAFNHIVAPNCSPYDLDTCQSDNQCPGDQKCCMQSCAKHCVDPS